MIRRRTVRNVQILKATVVVSGIVLIVAGIIMVFMDIRSEGSITIKTPLVGGHVNATHIGLLAIFSGVVLELAALLKSYSFSKRSAIIESPDLKIKEEEETEMTRPVDGERGEE